MKLDPKLIREAQEAYRQWNEARLRERMRNAGRTTPEESWQQYIDLWEFCRQTTPPQSECQRNEKYESLERYYERVQKLEEWRRAKGKLHDAR